MQPEPAARDGLAVDVVLHVAAGEHAGHARVRPVVRHDVAVGVERRAASRTAPCSACGRSRRTRPPPASSLRCAGLHVPQHDAGHDALVDVRDVLDHRVPAELDLRVGGRLVLHDLRRAQRVAPVDQRDLRRELREEDRLLQRRVAAADDRDRPVADRRSRRTSRTSTRRGPSACRSDGSPSSRADAPVAMISARAVYSCSSVVTVNGRRERSTDVTWPWMISAPNRSAWPRIEAISSGPMIPSLKPGKFSTAVVIIS